MEVDVDRRNNRSAGFELSHTCRELIFTISPPLNGAVNVEFFAAIVIRRPQSTLPARTIPIPLSIQSYWHAYLVTTVRYNISTLRLASSRILT
jgi:hypothetical protein